LKIKAYARFKKCYENLSSDIHYCISFEIIGDTIFLRVIGNHDEVLQKP